MLTALPEGEFMLDSPRAMDENTPRINLAGQSVEQVLCIRWVGAVVSWRPAKRSAIATVV